MVTCTSITGDLRIIDDGDLIDPIIDLTPLIGMTSIGRDFYLQNTFVTDMTLAMPLLTNIGRDIRINNNSLLTNLGLLPLLNTSSIRDIIVQDNPSLTNINSLDGISAASRNVNIRNNVSLQNVDGLSNLNSVGGNFSIFGNTAMTSVDLNDITTIGGSLTLQNNGALTDLDVPNLVIIGNNVLIVNNDALLNLDGLSLSIIIGNGLTIQNNNSLNDISALLFLAAIGGSLVINNNDALPSLDGLEGLAGMIPGSITISNNGLLTDITALSNITDVGLNLIITNNDMLVTLDGLENIVTAANLTITGNAVLSDCAAACTVVNLMGLSGSVTVSGNVGACNNTISFGNLCALVLPVELTSFSAVPARDHILLNWATATELNNAGFQVQRSENDGRDFQDVAWVKGLGTSQSAASYAYKDFDVKPGVRYTYRLMQVDLDGVTTASPVVTASLKGRQVVIGAQYPNPISPNSLLNVPVYLPQETTLQLDVIDALGKVVFTKQQNLAEGNHLLDVPTDAFSSGVFRLRINADGTTLASSSFVVTQ